MLALRADSAAEANREGLMVLQSWLIVCGIYLWEFFTTLDYEWSIIRGHQRYRWTIWIYSAARLSCLTAVVLILVNFSITYEINCQAWVVSGYVISAVGCYGLGSILIMLRIFAIWDKNKVIMAISAIIWFTNMGYQLSGIARIHAVWVPTARTCANSDYRAVKTFSVNALATDVTLLLIMLAGLIRLRLRDRTFIDLAYVLWKQGVIWLVIATAAELPQVLLLYLSTDVNLNSLFLVPSMITIVIAATRTYRALTYYSPSLNASGPGSGSSNLRKSSHLVSSTKTSPVVHITSNRLEVTARRPYEEYPMSNRYGSHPSSDTQPADKPPHELGLDDDIEVSGREDNK